MRGAICLQGPHQVAICFVGTGISVLCFCFESYGMMYGGIGKGVGMGGHGRHEWMRVEAGLESGVGRTQSRTIKEGSARAASNSALLR